MNEETISPGQQAHIFRNIYREILTRGKTHSPRGLKTLEIENFSFTLPPYVRFTNFRSRKMNLDYIKKEILWYLKGELTDLSICEHAKIWQNIIVDGALNSNYGHYIFKTGGMDWVVEELSRDKDSRRAVIPILGAYHLKSSTKDVPCTYAISFRIRDNKLNISVRLRSNDAIFGVTNDLPAFSLFQEIALCYLQQTYPELKCGEYHHGADSFHVYERHFDMLKKLAAYNPVDPYKEVYCPRISSIKEIEFLRKGEFGFVPQEYLLTHWLLDNS